MIKEARGTIWFFLFDSCWDSQRSTLERFWPLLGNDSIQRHYTDRFPGTFTLGSQIP